MNPITNFLNNLSIPTVNIVSALIFFVIAAKVTTPTFFDNITILQLFSAAVSLFAFINSSVVTRDVTYMFAKNEIDVGFISTVLLTPLLASPVFLILLLFPNFIKLSILYLIPLFFFQYVTAILIGLNRFAENAISWTTFLSIRWVVSLVAVFLHNVSLFIVIWIVAAVVSSTYSFLVLRRSVPGFSLTFSVKSFKKVVKASLTLYLQNVSDFFSSQGDRLIVMSFLGSYFLAVYQFSALLADVPAMLLRAINDSVLVSSSYFKARGVDELKMSRLTFKIVLVLSVLMTIISLPLARFLVPILFPEYQVGLNAMSILMLSITLSIPFIVMSQFIISFKRDLKPFVFISLTDAILVITTSIFFIPRLGILGGAISQLIVAVVNDSLYLAYSVRVKVFSLGRKEVALLALLPFMFVYELFLTQAYFSVLLGISLLLGLKISRIFERDELDVIGRFIEKIRL
ncbi:MAG: lipopolysaccharide biosynthesis protein [Metallosphaera sp.]|uniref:lipopolysaccharide biosynthesis protein n=1 Tax=Metallosphaera sp. TaxID=2020860 RepID=UPI003164CD98